MSDEDVAAVATRLAFEHNTLHHFHAQFALQQAGASTTVQQFLQAFHADAWITVGSQSDRVRAAIGSWPGDCCADVVFGFTWSKVLKAYEKTVVEHDVLDTLQFMTFHICSNLSRRIKDTFLSLGRRGWMMDDG